MRTITWLFVWCSVVLSSGCAIWENETSNRGGYLDYLADRHWLKADSKSMRALRAFAIQVSLARIASVSAKNDSDRQLLAIRIGATTKRFLPIYYCAFERNPLAVSGAKRDPCFYYDSAMVDYSTALFDLAMVALPVEDAKKLLNSVTGVVSGGAVNPLNIADLLESLVALGKDALKYGRVVGGLYRDTVELEVQVWLATPGIDRRPLGTRVTEADVFALREVYDRKSDNMPAWIAAVDALRARGLEPVPHSKFFDQLGGLMRYICDLITTEAEASNACKVGLPTTLPPPMSALGTLKVSRVGSIRTSGLGGGEPSGPSRGETGGANAGQSGQSGQSQSRFITNPQSKREEKVRLLDGQRIQQALCVDPSNGDFGTAQTKTALREFKSAYYGRAFTEAESAIRDDNEFADLFKAVRMRRSGGVIPPCGPAVGLSSAADVGRKARERGL